MTEFGGDEVVAAKAGAGSHTFSMAYAGFIYTETLLKAICGEDHAQGRVGESSWNDGT